MDLVLQEKFTYFSISECDRLFSKETAEKNFYFIAFVFS